MDFLRVFRWIFLLIFFSFSLRGALIDIADGRVSVAIVFEKKQNVRFSLLYSFVCPPPAHETLAHLNTGQPADRPVYEFRRAIPARSLPRDNRAAGHCSKFRIIIISIPGHGIRFGFPLRFTVVSTIEFDAVHTLKIPLGPISEKVKTEEFINRNTFSLGKKRPSGQRTRKAARPSYCFKKLKPELYTYVCGTRVPRYVKSDRSNDLYFFLYLFVLLICTYWTE